MIKWRKIVQTIFLVMFIALIAAGKSQVWMGLFLLGILLAMFVGPIYCGLMCPINTVTGLIAWILQKLGVKRLGVPGLIKKPVFRYGMLAAFIAVMLLVLVSGKKIPILVVMLILGAVLSIFFHESIWHNYLCPFGTIINAASSFARKFLNIEPVLMQKMRPLQQSMSGRSSDKSET